MSGKIEQTPHDRSQHLPALDQKLVIEYSPAPMAEMGRKYTRGNLKRTLSVTDPRATSEKPIVEQSLTDHQFNPTLPTA